ncbi:XcbB/CpsF family capsular polysaccharide biosynthesis protein [Actinomyces procaprae]|uniref:XcbB/CpsF family capsular polysaccharide biosynthesis protein n=1 Tax=Actinomyces procaprae TaxID=2560010 RepID=UPI0014487AFE|nr:XcbB/CpsF family capsular polysaccharide biosynthesis protein [Actinomyces procaprae]
MSPIALARRCEPVHRAIAGLASFGYVLYRTDQGESRFAHRSRVSRLWKSAIDGDLTDYHGVFFAKEGNWDSGSRLVVVFSGMAMNPSSSSLDRYFEKNYRHIRGLLPHTTAILRIADVGSVNGAFYRNTRDFPDREVVVSELIEQCADQLGVARNAVVLIGSSKGATAAVLYGLRDAYTFIAVDPVLSDRYYEEELGDLHFTRGPVYLDSKNDRFARLLDGGEFNGCGLFISSEVSAQFDTVRGFVQRLESGSDVRLYVSNDPRIDSHPTVARNTNWLVNYLLVCFVEGWPYPAGGVVD